jgi:hypothetical protein
MSFKDAMTQKNEVRLLENANNIVKQGLTVRNFEISTITQPARAKKTYESAKCAKKLVSTFYAI